MRRCCRMGYYTRFHFNSRLSRDMPKYVRKLLEQMVYRHHPEPEPDPLPDHPLFKTRYWRHMFRMSSSSFHLAKAHRNLEHSVGQWHLHVDCDLKNVDEIQHFLDWIEPHVDAFHGDLLGYYRGEDDPLVLVYWFDDDGNGDPIGHPHLAYKHVELD